MILPDQISDYEKLERCLRACKGARWAVTINQLQGMLGLGSRRETEQLLEDSYERIPFPVVAGSEGYYIPTTADEINHYYASLRSRARKIFRRMGVLRRRALAVGYEREGHVFTAAPAQLRLPEMEFEQMALFGGGEGGDHG